MFWAHSVADPGSRKQKKIMENLTFSSSLKFYQNHQKILLQYIVGVQNFVFEKCIFVKIKFKRVNQDFLFFDLVGPGSKFSNSGSSIRIRNTASAHQNFFKIWSYMVPRETCLYSSWWLYVLLEFGRFEECLLACLDITSPLCMRYSEK